METVNIRIGPLEFDHADYGADSDASACMLVGRSPAKAEKRPRTRCSLRARHPANRWPDRHQRTSGPGPRRTAHRDRA